MNTTLALDRVFDRLENAYDYAAWHWQPNTSQDYVCISAILVQHTNWSNVDQALARLDEAGALSLDTIQNRPPAELARLIRPAGTPDTKAQRLLALAALAAEHGGLAKLLSQPTDELRDLLLATNGIGPETADAILLYAAGRPTFVVDAYARRISSRLGIGPGGDRYEVWQAWFQNALPADAAAYQRYHGLLVLHGKHTCRPRPRCAACCLLDVCAEGQRSAGAA
jgi:endonuclease-3 related protein